MLELEPVLFIWTEKRVFQIEIVFDECYISQLFLLYAILNNDCWTTGKSKRWAHIRIFPLLWFQILIEFYLIGHNAKHPTWVVCVQSAKPHRIDHKIDKPFRAVLFLFHDIHTSHSWNVLWIWNSKKKQQNMKTTFS